MWGHGGSTPLLACYIRLSTIVAHIKTSGLIGRKYAADVNADGFEVNGQEWGWRVKWPGVRDKGEDERVFMFYAANTLFIIGKKYLSEDQQKELRQLAKLG